MRDGELAVFSIDPSLAFADITPFTPAMLQWGRPRMAHLADAKTADRFDAAARSRLDPEKNPISPTWPRDTLTAHPGRPDLRLGPARRTDSPRPPLRGRQRSESRTAGGQ